MTNNTIWIFANYTHPILHGHFPANLVIRTRKRWTKFKYFVESVDVENFKFEFLKLSWCRVDRRSWDRWRNCRLGCVILTSTVSLNCILNNTSYKRNSWNNLNLISHVQTFVSFTRNSIFVAEPDCRVQTLIPD